MTDWPERFVRVVQRELQTLARTRSVWAMAIGFFGVTLGTTFLSGAGGYVPISLSLVTPMELLVPVLAAGLGYRAILADRERGELHVLRTYPIAPETFIGGVYIGRLVVLLCILIGSLLITGFLVPLSKPSPAALTQTAGLDSPLLYLRFVILTAVFSGVVLAVLVLLSTLVRNARRGLIVTILLASTVAIGFDLLIILGLAGQLISADSLPWYLALSPGSAYRGLVMTYVVAPAVTTVVGLTIPLLSTMSLCLWTFISLVLAGEQVWK